MLYNKALPLQEALIGTTSPEVAATLESYANLLRTMENDAPAMELENRARRIRAELAYTRSIDNASWQEPGRD